MGSICWRAAVTAAAESLLWLLWGMFHLAVTIVPADIALSQIMPWDGVSVVIRLESGSPAEVLKHELTHAGDVLNDGRFNGNFGPSVPAEAPEWLPDWARDHCMRPVEYPACVAQLRPQQMLDWMVAPER